MLNILKFCGIFCSYSIDDDRDDRDDDGDDDDSDDEADDNDDDALVTRSAAVVCPLDPASQLP